MPEIRKREIANKIRIGDLLRGNQIFEESESLNKLLRFVELGNRKIVRVNIIANIIDKFESEGESKFASLTLDDGSGQIRVRVFGEDVIKVHDFTQGDTMLIVGVLRSYNQELYILPEILKKQDPKYLLVRKLELEKDFPSTVPTPEMKKEVKAFRDDIIGLIKGSEDQEGIDKDIIITKLEKAPPRIITEEIKKLLEEGIIYEPRPGRVRYLG